MILFMIEWLIQHLKYYRYYFGEINLKTLQDFRNTDDMIDTVSRQGEQ